MLTANSYQLNKLMIRLRTEMSTQSVESLTDQPLAVAVFISTLGVCIKAPFLRNREGAQERCQRDSLWSFSRSWSPEPGDSSFPCLLLEHSFNDNALPHAIFSEGGCRIEGKLQQDGEDHHHDGITLPTHQRPPWASMDSLTKRLTKCPGRDPSVHLHYHLRSRQRVYFFSALCAEILMLHEISRCGNWDTICIDIILGYDFSTLWAEKEN